MPKASVDRARDQPTTTIRWEIAVPLLPNRLMLVATAKIFALAALLCWALVAFLLALQGAFAPILPLGGLFAALGLGVAVVGYGAAIALYRNRIDWRFSLTAKHARCQRIDRRAQMVDALAIGLGTLAGKPGAVGAGLVSASLADISVSWRSVARVTPYPAQNAIALGNVWRTTAVLYCPPDRYEAILAVVRARVAQAPRSRRPNPVPGLLARSAVAIVAALPLFRLPVAIDGFAPYLTLCFALAAIWLLPALAWVAFTGLGWIAVATLVAALAPIRSSINGASWPRYALFSGDDWAMLVLAGVGGACLIWLGTRIVTGRIASGLAGDLDEADD